MMQSCAGNKNTEYPSVRSMGLTLPELLVSLAVTSIITLAALDCLPQFIQSNRMAGEVNRFLGVLQLARSEAVKRGRRLVLCPQTDQGVCADHANWEDGWLLFVSENRERAVDEPLIVADPPLAEFINMRSGNQRRRIVYQADGSSGGTNSSFTFCDRRGLAKPRVVCLSNTGRPRTMLTRCNGSPIDCP